jgi:hydrogenase nickel incorporation protein HypA/HybF
VHELTVAQRLVERAEAAAYKAGAERVDAVTVEVGVATHLVPDQLAFCIEAMAEDTPVAGADVRFNRVQARGECRCGWTGELDALEGVVGGAPDRRCPDCGRGVDLTDGRGCRLVSVEVPQCDPRGGPGERDAAGRADGEPEGSDSTETGSGTGNGDGGDGVADAPTGPSADRETDPVRD